MPEPGAPEPLPPRLFGDFAESDYPALRALAASLLRRESPSPTVQPTAIANEVYLRLAATMVVDKSHFFNLAATAIRHLLVDRARERAALKRRGAAGNVTLDTSIVSDRTPEAGVLELDEIVTRLGDLDARAAQVVTLRLFAGRTVSEVADLLGIARSTVQKDWDFARAFLARELAGTPP